MHTAIHRELTTPVQALSQSYTAAMDLDKNDRSLDHSTPICSRESRPLPLGEHSDWSSWRNQQRHLGPLQSLWCTLQSCGWEIDHVIIMWLSYSIHLHLIYSLMRIWQLYLLHEFYENLNIGWHGISMDRQAYSNPIASKFWCIAQLLYTHWIKIKGLCQAGLVVLRYSSIFLALWFVLDCPDAKQSSHIYWFLEEAVHKDSNKGGIGSMCWEKTSNHPRIQQK